MPQLEDARVLVRLTPASDDLLFAYDVSTNTVRTITLSGLQQTQFDYLQFNLSPTNVPTTEGTLSWDATDRTLKLQTDIPDTAIQVGQESLIRVHNNSGSTITNGQVVAITGSTGQRASVSKAIASSASIVRSVIGVATHTMLHGEDGYVTTFGLVRDINTNAYNEGDTLYLSAATAGAITKTAPTAPNYVIRIGWVVKKAGGAGMILAAPDREICYQSVVDALGFVPAPA